MAKLLPTKGPMVWLGSVLTSITATGLCYYWWLSFISPTDPDPARGLIYAVPARLHDFYVDRSHAIALWALFCGVMAFFTMGWVYWILGYEPASRLPPSD